MKAKLVSLRVAGLVCLAVLLYLLPPAANAATQAKLGGAFNLTMYGEPGLTELSTWCFVFTTTGGVLGFPNSGTWNVPSYSYGWSGEWYQNGDEIILHGVADGIYIFSWKGRLLASHQAGGRFAEFYIDGRTDYAGTFSASKVSGCGAATSKIEDPNRK